MHARLIGVWEGGVKRPGQRLGVPHIRPFFFILVDAAVDSLVGKKFHIPVGALSVDVAFSFRGLIVSSLL